MTYLEATAVIDRLSSVFDANSTDIPQASEVLEAAKVLAGESGQTGNSNLVEEQLGRPVKKMDAAFAKILKELLALAEQVRTARAERNALTELAEIVESDLPLGVLNRL